MDIIYEISPDTGTVHVDVIKSHISFDRQLMMDTLDKFERGEYGNYDMSDIMDDILWENLCEELRKKLNLNKSVRINLVYYDDHKFNLTEYRETLDWMAYERISYTNFYPIFRSEVPFIRDFLNTPLGQEEEAVKRWNDYWDKVDFESRLDVAPMYGSES